LKHLADGIALGVDTDVHRHFGEHQIHIRVDGIKYDDQNENNLVPSADWSGMSVLQSTKPEEDPWFVRALPSMEEQRMAVLRMKSYPELHDPHYLTKSAKGATPGPSLDGRSADSSGAGTNLWYRWHEWTQTIDNPVVGDSSDEEMEIDSGKEASV
jgi:hypothetical protein